MRNVKFKPKTSPKNINLSNKTNPIIFIKKNHPKTKIKVFKMLKIKKRSKSIYLNFNVLKKNDMLKFVKVLFCNIKIDYICTNKNKNK